MLKQNYEKLVSALKDDDDTLEFIKERMDHICNYVDKVTMMEYTIPILNARFEGQDLRDKIENLDSQRRIAHEMAISAVKQLNRICVANSIDKLYTGDEDNRYEIADFCGLVVTTLFEDRTR